VIVRSGHAGNYLRAAAMSESFAVNARKHQLAWARNGGVPVSALELRHGQLSWVLKREHRKLNLFRTAWWEYIAHAEHRWSRALNSSQCFAVNVFAPLAEDSARARRTLQALLPRRDIRPEDDVSVRFEYTPGDAPAWMGEREQSTQVDVYLRVTRSHRCIGHVLVEVKYSESSFGCCRGWGSKTDNAARNPNRSRCLNTTEITLNPQANCWRAEAEGRRYWELMSASGSSLQISAIRAAGICPFRHGLYQMMRNRVLADELARHAGPAWADFALCRHPANDAVVFLDKPVFSLRNAIRAFRFISSDEAVCDWDAQQLVEIISSTDDVLKNWEAWMMARYFG
jgi:hypothetical protein